jgi:polar amino acid transport system substrate-binding protein
MRGWRVILHGAAVFFMGLHVSPMRQSMPPRTNALNSLHLLPQRRRLLGFGLAAYALALSPAHAASATALKFSRIGAGPELARLESALAQAYANLGIQITYIDLPGERAIVESNAGRLDGETARIEGMEVVYPALRRIDVPLYINTNSIFVYGADKVAPTSINQLANLKRVGIVGGWKASEEATAGWGNVVRLTTYGAALQMLKRGRLDAFLGRGEDSLRALQEEKLALTDFPNKIVLRHPLFHYLHEKHEDLIPAITRELRKLKGSRDVLVESWLPLQ